MIENAVRVASEKIKAEYDVILHQQLCGMSAHSAWYRGRY